MMQSDTEKAQKNAVVVSTESPRDVSLRIYACARALAVNRNHSAPPVPIIVIVPRRLKELAWKEMLPSALKAAVNIPESEQRPDVESTLYIFSLEALDADPTAKEMLSGVVATQLETAWPGSAGIPGSMDALPDLIVDLVDMVATTSHSRHLTSRHHSHTLESLQDFLASYLLPRVRLAIIASERPLIGIDRIPVAATGTSARVHCLLPDLDSEGGASDAAEAGFISIAAKVDHAALYVELPLAYIKEIINPDTEHTQGTEGWEAHDDVDAANTDGLGTEPSYLRTIVAKKTAAVVKDIVMVLDAAKTTAERNMQAFIVVSPTKYGVGSDAFAETLEEEKKRARRQTDNRRDDNAGHTTATLPSTTVASLESTTLYSSIQKKAPDVLRTNIDGGSRGRGVPVVYLVDDGVRFDDPTFFPEKLREMFEYKSSATIYILQPTSHDGGFLSLVETIQSFAAASISKLRVVYVLTQYLASPDAVLQEKLTATVQLLSSMGAGNASVLRGSLRDMTGEYATAMYKYNAAIGGFSETEVAEENTPINEIRSFLQSVERYMFATYPALRKFFSDAQRFRVPPYQASVGSIDPSQTLPGIHIHDVTQEYDDRISEQMNAAEEAGERASGGLLDVAYTQGAISDDEFLKNEQRVDAMEQTKLQASVSEIQARTRNNVIAPLSGDAIAIETQRRQAEQHVKNILSSANVQNSLPDLPLSEPSPAPDAAAAADALASAPDNLPGVAAETQERLNESRRRLEDQLALEHNKLDQQLAELSSANKNLLDQVEQVISGAPAQAYQQATARVREQHARQLEQLRLQTQMKSLQTTKKNAGQMVTLFDPANTTQQRAEQSTQYMKQNAAELVRLQRYAFARFMEEKQRPAFRADWQRLFDEYKKTVDDAAAAAPEEVSGESLPSKAARLVLEFVGVLQQRYTEYLDEVTSIKESFIEAYNEQEIQRIMREAEQANVPEYKVVKNPVPPSISVDEAAPEKLFEADMLVPETCEPRKPRTDKLFVKSEDYIECVLRANVTDMDIRNSMKLPSVIKALIYESNRAKRLLLGDPSTTSAQRDALHNFYPGKIVKAIFDIMKAKKKAKASELTLKQYAIFLRNWAVQLDLFFTNKSKGSDSFEASEARQLAARFPRHAAVLSPISGVDKVLLVGLEEGTETEEKQQLQIVLTTVGEIAQQHLLLDRRRKDEPLAAVPRRWLLCVAPFSSNDKPPLEQKVRAAAIAPDNYNKYDCARNRDQLEFSVEDTPTGSGAALQTKLTRAEGR